MLAQKQAKMRPHADRYRQDCEGVASSLHQGEKLKIVSRVAGAAVAGASATTSGTAGGSMSLPCVFPLHAYVPSVCIFLHAYVPSVYFPPCVCPCPDAGLTKGSR